MARADFFTSENLTAIKSQLRPFLAAFGDGPPGSSPDLGGVAESFQVWTVPLASFRASGVEGAFWNQVWHHQIRQPNGSAQSFARSVMDRGVLVVRAVYRSPLAQDIDEAINRIDADPVFRDDSFLVRLLEIPDLHLTSMWLSQAGTNRYIPLGGFASVGGQRFAAVSEANLIAQLPTESVTGLAEIPPPDRRTDF